MRVISKRNSTKVNLSLFCLLIFSSSIIYSVLINSSSLRHSRGDDGNSGLDSDIHLKNTLHAQAINESIRVQNNTRFNGLTLNDSISFTLNSTSYCNEAIVEFESLEDTKEYINNGGFESGTNYWSDTDESDVKFNHDLNGPEGRKCVSINLTGIKSNHTKRPINEPEGVEDFEDPNALDNWYFKSNDSSNFEQKRDYKDVLRKFTLLHNYSISFPSSIGMANASFKFHFNSSFPLRKVNLSFVYDWFIQNIAFNKIEVGVNLITPSKKVYLINGWFDEIEDEIEDSSSGSRSKFFANISNYFNETGYYNLTFYSIHYAFTTGKNLLYFDDIEMVFEYKMHRISKDEQFKWSQSSTFNKDVAEDASLTFNYYCSDLINHINSSDIHLMAWVNGRGYNVSDFNNIINGSWQSASILIDKSIIEASQLNVEIGISFNQTSTDIYYNESFALYIDDVSFIIKTNPPPSFIDLQVYVPKLKTSHVVNRNAEGTDLVRIFNENSSIWEPGKTHVLNITCNVTNIRADVLLTTFIYQNITKNGGNDDNDESNGDTPVPINVSMFLLAFILMIMAASALFVVRIEKQLFLAPELEYVKKLKVKQVKRKPGEKAERKLVPCKTCGKPINARSSFCEHCGAQQ